MKATNIWYIKEISEELGLYAAIIFECIAYWVEVNKENDVNFHDEKYWMYDSATEFSKVLPDMNNAKVYRNIKKLIDAGYIIRGNYNKLKYDKTSWYTLTDKGAALAYRQEKQEENV